MKIKTVIRAFKKILPIYEKAYALKITNKNKYYRLLDKKHISYGICLAFMGRRISIENIFSYDGYYKNYVKNRYLYNIPYYAYVIGNNSYNSNDIKVIKEMKKCLKFRIDFLKREIKHLEKLSLKYDEI